MRIDVVKDRPELYRPSSTDFVEIKVPPLRYLCIDGAGDPNTSPAYAAALQSLYSLTYAVTIPLKRATGTHVVVPPLEGLWHADDPNAFVTRHKGEWRWTMMLHLPEVITEDLIADARQRVQGKHPDLPLERVEVHTLTEGRCLQILHIGSYDDEAPTLHRLHHELMPQRGLTWNGPHHEIYLSDPRRTAPERLRTILRQPVRPVS